MANQADTFVEFVMDQLERVRNLRCCRMFGGHGLYCGEAFFGIVSKSRLYFKTDATTRVAYIDRDSSPFRPNPKQELQNYYEVPLEILEDRDELLRWATEAVAASERATRKKAKPGKR